MQKILILIGGHLANSPRAQKEANTLSSAGYSVTVGGIWSNPKYIEEDKYILENKSYRFHPILDFSPENKIKNIEKRIKSRLSKYLYKNLSLFSPIILGYGTNEMLKFATQFNADMTIVHSEPGLWVANSLLDKGLKVGVDLEDWFSEDLLDDSRKNRPIKCLKQLEKKLLNNCKYCLTTSQAMSDALSEAYDVYKPTVIYNTFPLEERERIDHKIKDKINTNTISLHWFSQTIGPGRGLELLSKSLSYIKEPIEIHIRGNVNNYSDWIESIIPTNWKNKIFIHATVYNSDLISRISEHDIGLALEEPYCLNKEYTISNKLFQYILGGLAIIATDTKGQREILSKCPKIGKLIPCSNPKILAQTINNYAINKKELQKSKIDSLNSAKTIYNWENQEERIIKLIKNALN